MFQVEIWGTVSDWITIGITAITAYLLWRTLYSQVRVQELQQKITNIEIYRFRESIRPSFNVKIISNVEALEANKIKLITEFIFYVKEYLAENIIIKITNINNEFKPTDSMGVYNFDGLEPNDHLRVNGTYETEYSLIEDKPIYITTADIVITYSDTERNKYEQKITCILRNGESFIFARTPVLK